MTRNKGIIIRALIILCFSEGVRSLFGEGRFLTFRLLDATVRFDSFHDIAHLLLC